MSEPYVIHHDWCLPSYTHKDKQTPQGINMGLYKHPQRIKQGAIWLSV